MSPYSIPPLLGTITSLIIGSVVFSRNRRSPLHRYFFYFCLCLSGWLFGYTISYSATNPVTAGYFADLACTCVALTAPALYAFTAVYVRRRQELPWVRWSMIGIVAQLPFFLFTDLFLKTPYHYFFGYYSHAGPLHPFHLVYWYGLFARIYYLLLRHYLTALKGSDVEANRAKYVLLAYLMLTLCSTDYLPKYGLPFYPFGALFALGFCGVIAYAVSKHHLFDIEVVIKRTVVFAGLSLGVLGIVGMVSLWLPGHLFRAFGIHADRLWPNTMAAILIAAGYGPLRVWLVNATDRYLFQKHYDYRELLKRFTEQIVGLVDLRQLVEMTVTTLSETMKLQSCGLWLREHESPRYQLAAARGASGVPAALDSHAPLLHILAQVRRPLSLPELASTTSAPEQLTTLAKSLRARLLIPLILHEELIGVIALGQKKSDAAFTSDDLSVLAPLGTTLAIAISNSRLFHELRKTQAEVIEQEALATIDALTGVLLRRPFLERAHLALANVQAAQQPAAVLMLDLDGFKRINDTLGHMAGDAVLQEVAHRVNRMVRPADLVGRFGGEEFICLLPGVDPADALGIAERMRESVAASPIIVNGRPVAQTVSIGLSAAPRDGHDLEALIAKADKALYSAKRGGRNRVIGTAEEPGP